MRMNRSKVLCSLIVAFGVFMAAPFSIVGSYSSRDVSQATVTTTTTISVAPTPVPGFPVESILLGMLFGLSVLILLRLRNLNLGSWA